MATKKEIEQHLNLALAEIGMIKPWFDKEVNAWVFEHPNYLVGYAGKSAKEVIKKYPLHLQMFIEERLNDNLDSRVEQESKGHGGVRSRAGRPIGSIKDPTKQIRVPIDIADWLKQPGFIPSIRQMLSTPYKHV